MIGKDGFRRAFGNAAHITLMTAGVTMGIGYMRNDFSAVIPAVTFAYLAAMGTAGKYERILASVKKDNNAAPSPD